MSCDTTIKNGPKYTAIVLWGCTQIQKEREKRRGGGGGERSRESRGWEGRGGGVQDMRMNTPPQFSNKRYLTLHAQI